MRKFGMGAQGGPVPPKEHEAIDFLSNLMVCHIPGSDGNMKMKAVYVGLMVRRSVGSIG
ncbi:unnamed protein product [Anisakis simplex]|uniref:Uncharacterized protein n=1 Tax=Anisakis simplex TaxID=6269 RepID=A0A0M3JM11_ANISI|nr:unnamed protein product [Anisakis simplex]